MRPAERTVLYTAIFGDYDDLIVQPDMPGVDLVAFTDNPELRSHQWEVRLTASQHAHPRMAAKWYKLHPHDVLPGHDHSVWIDGGVQIERSDFATVVLDALSNDGLSLFAHPARDTIRAEAEFCVPLPKYAGLPMLEQVDHYASRGFPDRSGLWAGGIIGRHHNPLVQRLGEQWWQENVRWTYQDQLSLSYVLWRLSVTPGVIPSGLGDGDLLTMREHRHPSR